MMRYHSKAHHHHHPVPRPTPVWLILMYLWGVPRGQSLCQATEVHSQDWVEFHYRKYHNFTMHTHELHWMWCQHTVPPLSYDSLALFWKCLQSFYVSLSAVTVFCVCTSHIYWLFKPPCIWCVVLPCLNTTCVTSHKSFCVQVCLLCVYCLYHVLKVCQVRLYNNIYEPKWFNLWNNSMNYIDIQWKPNITLL